MIKPALSLSTKFKEQVNSFYHCFHQHSLATRLPCALCLGRCDAGQQRLCTACKNDLPGLHQACRQCALPLPSNDSPCSAGLCGECLQQAPAFDQVRAGWRYAFPLDAMIGGYKYQGRRLLGRALAVAFAEQLSTISLEDRPDCLLPSPLHATRLGQRGFNQAAEIAQWLGQAMAIPVNYQALQRIAPSPAQSTLDRAARLRNVRDSFRVTQSLPQHVAIIDDVMTTGATAEAISRVLRDQGVKRIQVWVLARTPKPDGA